MVRSRNIYDDHNEQLEPTPLIEDINRNVKTTDAELVLREALQNSSKLGGWYNPETDHQ